MAAKKRTPQAIVSLTQGPRESRKALADRGRTYLAEHPKAGKVRLQSRSGKKIDELKRRGRPRTRRARPALANERLRDFQVGHEVRLLGLSKSEGRELRAVLRSADERLEAKILSLGPRTKKKFTRNRSIALRKSINGILAPSHDELRKQYDQYVRELTALELEAQAGALGRTLVPIEAEFARVSAIQALAVVRSRPMDGAILSEWTTQLKRNDAARTFKAIQSGIISGQSNPEIVRAVIGSGPLGYKDGIREVSRRGAQALVRTTTNHVASAARNELYSANADIIAGVIWVSTLDGKTSPICRALDGNFYPLEEGPRPPAHINCRSTTSPVLKDFEELGSRIPPGATRASKAPDFTGQVPATTNYTDWLEGRSSGFQDEILGSTRGKLFRTGEIDMAGFVNADGRLFTLPQLRKRLPDLFDEAGL